MKKLKYILITLAFASLINCIGPKKKNTSQLDYIEFQSPKDELCDSLVVATYFLDELSNKGGSFLHLMDDSVFFMIKKEKHAIRFDDKGELIFDSASYNPYNSEDTQRLVKLFLFLSQNHINSMSKWRDGLCRFSYRQRELNPNNNFTQSRTLILQRDPRDTCSVLYKDLVVLDTHKNLVLTAPRDYNK